MDNRSIFLYHLECVMSEGGTQEGKHRSQLELGVQAGRRVLQANPQGRYLREVTGSSVSAERTGRSHTAEKNLVASASGDRTVNRHR